jgi:UDP-N-acetylglucosamine 4-epimerase
MKLDAVLADLEASPRTWLVTGVAGFIGSNLLQALLEAGQRVRGLDNFSTGYQANLDEVRAAAAPGAWARFTFIQGDIRSLEDCRLACEGAKVVLHQAAPGAVPRSIADPLGAHESNVDGFVNMLVAARDAKVARFVYAASSAVYGDQEALPKREGRIGEPLSPYAVTKLVNEIYAKAFGRVYGMETIGLRYFNVFGRRQDPEGPYAAVIPLWITRMLHGSECSINGDGETSRDFCYVQNAVQANLLAAAADLAAVNEVYNVAFGGRTTLNQLHEMIRSGLAMTRPEVAVLKPRHGPFREGDIAHSQADIGKAARLLGYEPRYDVRRGLEEALAWYCEHLR